MKSAVAELIGEFLARGGTITRLPDGIGLGEPVMKAKAVVGQARRASKGRREICARVMAVLTSSPVALSMLGLEAATGYPIDRLRGALADLERAGSLTGTAGGRGRTRFFQLANSGAGDHPGGPASASASGARAGAFLTPDVRPGKAA